MSLFFKKLNNAGLWDKIQKLRELIKAEKNFKKRTCWNCRKDLNIYDFLSDNVDFSPEYILKLWQASILEFHCCECFRELKIKEIQKIENQLKIRRCSNCNVPLNIYNFARSNNYLKIKELNDLWLNEKKLIFCSRLCERYYFQKKLKKKIRF